MTMSLLADGTQKRTALEISDQLALLGAQFNAVADFDSSTASLSALRSKLAPSLELYADLILHPSFPEAEFRRQQKQQLAAIKREENSPAQVALRVLPGLVYGKDHPYGGPLSGSGTIQSISKMARQDVAKFYETWFRPNNATLIVVGDTTLDEIKPKLEKLFAGWKQGEVPTKDIKEVSPPAKPEVYLIDKPGAQQSVIVVGGIAPPPANPKEIAIEAMNAGLGGMFSSRINLNLREDKHWSYGSHSILLEARGDRLLAAVAPVQADKTKEAMEEIHKEFADVMGKRPLTAEELKTVQSHETLSLPGSKETMSAVGNSIMKIVELRLPDDYYDTYAGKVRALTTGDVADAAKIIVHPDNMVWIVVGDRSKIEAAVKESGLGEVRVLSPEGRVQP
jgi:zinc protease